jgi:hypothetical protein
MRMSLEYKHALAKVLDAAAAGEEGPRPLSTGEALMAALALNRPDWLARMGYTMVEAIERIGQEWMALLPRIAREVAQHQAAGEQAKRLASQALALTQAGAAGGAAGEPIDCEATLVTCGDAPGYRDAMLAFDLQPLNSQRTLRVEMRLRPQDGERIVRHLHAVHAQAWNGHEPLDVQPGERRPHWVDARL